MESALQFVRGDRSKTVIITILLTAPFMLLLIANPYDWAGILLIFGMYFSSFVIKDLTKSKKIFWSSLIVLTLHQIMAITNAYITETMGASYDAAVFQRDATTIAGSGIPVDLTGNGAGFYTNVLALFYKIFGSSYLLGLETSVLTFFISTIFLIKIASIVKLDRYAHVILLMYGFLPASIIFTSVILRESWQMMFFMMTVYCALSLRMHKSFKRFVYLLLSTVGLSFWHNGFLALAPVLVFITVFWTFKSKTKRFSVRDFFLLLIALVFIFVGFRLVGGSSDSSAASALTSGNGLDFIQDYRAGGDLGVGASYVSSISFSGPLGVLFNIPYMFVMYMFAPFPWQLRGINDLIALLDSVLRFFLLIGGLSAWKRSSGEQKSIYGFLLILYFLMEGLWSLGTINWGTAMRHHLVAYGILLVVGGPNFCRRIKKVALSIL